MLIDTNTVNLIYGSLADEMSRRVFIKRLSYSVVASTGNVRELARIQNPVFIDKVIALADSGYKVCVYGAGDSVWYPGRIALTLFNDILAFPGIVDQRAEVLHEVPYLLHYGEFAHVKVHRPEFLKQADTKTMVIVATSNPDLRNEIVNNLLAFEIPISRIIFFPESYLGCSGDYFTGKAFFTYNHQELFVDCGCFDGESAKLFAKSVEQQENASVAGIIGYEPDKKQAEICRQNLSEVPNTTIRNVGVWEKKETLRFSASGEGGSNIAVDGDVYIDAVKIDEDISGQRVTFIKMDIEGAELKALKGAVKTICSQRPKLAIYLYHKPEDIITIIEFLMNLSLGYKFYLRHQSLYFHETVLYAVP